MSELRAPEGGTHSRKRKGRGPSSGLGKTSGRGTKGQRSRSGGGVRPGFEGGQMPLYRRIARRGFSNYGFKVVYTPVSLSQLEERFENGDTVSWASLLAKGLIHASETKVKILGGGDVSTKLNVVGLTVSGPAASKIGKAGGSVVQAEASTETDTKAE